MLFFVLPVVAVGAPIMISATIWDYATTPHGDLGNEFCSINESAYNSTSEYLVPPEYDGKFESPKVIYWNDDDTDTTLLILLAILLAFSLVLGTPFIIALIFLRSERLMKLMPDINLWLSRITGRGYYFKKIKKLDSNVFEIPVFDNVFLDYKLTKDFKRQIQRVEIIEHDYWHQKMGLFGRKKGKEKQTDYWSAKFHFKEIPRTGYLEVKYI